ncbi:MAG: DMT family transporter [Nitrospinae bacterium]|nr:DMT family transporter [Nitrospinota bacterium]
MASLLASLFYGVVLLKSLDPNLLSFIAAFFVAISQVFYRKALIHIGPGIAAIAMNALTAMLAIMLYIAWDERVSWRMEGVMWYMLIGLFGSSVGRYMIFGSMRLIGLARTQIMVQSILVWSALVGVFILGERFSAGVAVGTFAIMIGAVLLVYKRESSRREPGEKDVALVYFLVPVIASFLFSLTFVFRKYAILVMPSESLGIAISTTTAMSLLLLAMPFTKEEGGMKGWSLRGVVTIACGVVANTIAALCFWTAFREGEVVQVIPINRLSVLWVIVFSWLFLKKQESVTLRIVIGGVLSVIGAFAIAWGK